MLAASGPDLCHYLKQLPCLASASAAIGLQTSSTTFSRAGCLPVSVTVGPSRSEVVRAISLVLHIHAQVSRCYQMDALLVHFHFTFAFVSVLHVPVSYTLQWLVLTCILLFFFLFVSNVLLLDVFILFLALVHSFPQCFSSCSSVLIRIIVPIDCPDLSVQLYTRFYDSSCSPF